MIIFDQLRISDDGKQMYINLHVNTASYFSSIYLDSIIIMTGNKVLESTDPFCASDNPENYIFKKTFEGNQKEAALVLPGLQEDVVNWNYAPNNLSGDLFFVYVKCKTVGTVDECFESLPCSLTNLTTVGVTFDSALLYQKVMDFTKQLADDCVVPLGFTDYILLWNAFKAAIDTEHWVPAVKYWNMLFGIGENGESYGPYGSGTTVGRSRRGCGCHG